MKGKAAIAEFRRNTDSSNMDWITIRTVAELRGGNGESLSINEGRWLDHDQKIRRSATVPFARLDTKRLAIVLGISNNKVYTYEGRYLKSGRGRLRVFYEFKQELQELTEVVYDVEIRLVGSEGGRVIVDDTFGFDLIRGAELKDGIFRKKNPCLLVPGMPPDKSEVIKRLSGFAEEGNELLRVGKAATEHLWPKARDWATRSEDYIREHISDHSAEGFSLATSEPWPGLAIDREFVNWVYTRVQRLGELASEVRES